MGEARAMNLSDDSLQRDDRKAVMLVYLNKYTYQDPNCILCRSIIKAINNAIQVVLVHENDPNQGGCEFWKVMEPTPDELMKKPYTIYSQDIAVSLYSVHEYQRTSLRNLLLKMGGTPINSQPIMQSFMNASMRAFGSSK